jgi:hypothetical protein
LAREARQADFVLGHWLLVFGDGSIAGALRSGNAQQTKNQRPITKDQQPNSP